MSAFADGSLGLNIIYYDPTATVLSDREFFIPSDTDFTGWDEVVLDIAVASAIAGSFVNARGILVPEPSTAVLFGLGLLGLLRMDARQRR